MVVLLRCSSGYLTSSRRPLSWAYGADQIGVGSKVEIDGEIRDPIRSTRAQVVGRPPPRARPLSAVGHDCRRRGITPSPPAPTWSAGPGASTPAAAVPPRPFR